MSDTLRTDIGKVNVVFNNAGIMDVRIMIIL